VLLPIELASSSNYRLRQYDTILLQVRGYYRNAIFLRHMIRYCGRTREKIHESIGVGDLAL
jgi:hypothetical protein